MRRAGTGSAPEIASPIGRESAPQAAAVGSQEAPTLDAIRVRAYELYLARGAEHGEPLQDWLRAEREVLLGVPGAMADEPEASTTA